MIFRKLSRADASLRAGPLQRLDKAGDRGQRRAQFVAGVGDEVGTHTVDPARLALILEDQHELRAIRPDAGPGHAKDPFDRHALDIVHDAAFRRPGQQALDQQLHFRCAEPALQRQARRKRPERSERRVVGVQRRTFAVENEDRVRHGGSEIGNRNAFEPPLAAFVLAIQLDLANGPARRQRGRGKHHSKYDCCKRCIQAAELPRRKQAGGERGKRPARAEQPSGDDRAKAAIPGLARYFGHPGIARNDCAFGPSLGIATTFTLDRLTATQ